jgi:hypothetical protein
MNRAHQLPDRNCGRALAFLIVACLLSSCDLPRDPEGTSQKLANGVLSVGLPNAELTEFEARMLEAVSAHFGATLRAVPGETHELVEALSRGDIHLIVSLPEATPFKEKIALTHPYRNPGRGENKRVWGVRAGENAWLMIINGHLASRTVR